MSAFFAFLIRERDLILAHWAALSVLAAAFLALGRAAANLIGPSLKASQPKFYKALVLLAQIAIAIGPDVIGAIRASAGKNPSSK